MNVAITTSKPYGLLAYIDFRRRIRRDVYQTGMQ